MTIEPGTTLAHYEILALLGKGGMGEVWRAKDTKLGRDVAIKILPEEFTKDAERLARFEREARVLASLNHPNVAGIFEVGSVDTVASSSPLHYLAMELAPGEDLSDRLGRGPVRIDEAVAMAKQIALALEAAHDQGIVHRDLKPANVKVDEDGNVKVLDFGLAKALETEEADEDFSNSPTMVRAATHAGVILGTAAYMSPEQARGKKVDKRADIWAFGVVLWEMLTGKRLFGGETVSDTLASVLKEEPDWNDLPDDTTPSIRRVLGHCLVKNPKERLHDIADARLELGDADVPVEGRGAMMPARSSRLPWIVAALAVTVALVAVASLWRRHPTPSTGETLYLRVPIEPAKHLSPDPSVTISPDGMTVVFRGNIDGHTQLLARKVTSSEVSIIQGSDGAYLPAFSPDGASIAFGARGTIWKASLSGGDSVSVTKDNSPNGFCWSSGGSMIYNGGWGTGLNRVSEAGGTPSVLTKAEPGTSHLWPTCLPDGRHALFTRWSAESPEAIAIYSVAISSGDVKEVIRDAKYARYYPPGVLTFLRGSTLMAIRFDPERIAVEGDPVSIVSRVSNNTGDIGASYDLSSTGTLVYVPESSAPDPKGFWVDLTGAEVGQVEAHLRQWDYPAISPDGTKLLVTEQGPAFQVWIIDLQGGPRSQLTSRFDNGDAIWTPDGEVVYFSNRHGRYEILRQSPDGTKQPEVLVTGQFPDPQDVSPDGRYLLYSDMVPGNDRDLFFLDLEAKGKPTALAVSPGIERVARLSPGGHYVAYQSTASGRNEIYVTPFPGPGTSWQISTGGGLNPLWAPDGRSLYFGDGLGGIMRVATTTEPAFRAGKPEKLFDRDYYSDGIGRDFAISPDGTKLLFIEAPDMTPYQRLNIGLNFGRVIEEKLPKQ